MCTPPQPLCSKCYAVDPLRSFFLRIFFLAISMVRCRFWRWFWICYSFCSRVELWKKLLASTNSSFDSFLWFYRKYRNNQDFPNNITQLNQILQGVLKDKVHWLKIEQNIESRLFWSESRWAYKNTPWCIIKLAPIDNIFFNIINSRHNQITFLYSFFHADHESEVTFSFRTGLANTVANTRSEWLLRITIVVPAKNLYMCFFSLSYILKDAELKGLSESVFGFLGWLASTKLEPKY